MQAWKLNIHKTGLKIGIKLFDDISRLKTDEFPYVSEVQQPGKSLSNLIDLFALIAMDGSVAENLLIDSGSRTVYRWNYRRNYSQRLIY